MSFDSSRFTFDPWKDFSGVVMPQGRVQLDSDWNEWLAELARRIRAGTLDTMGRAVYPSTTPNAFLITPTGSSVSIGVGRMYVDGLLVENHGLPAPQSGGWIPPAITPAASQPAWDPALDELVGQDPIDYLQQPYFPDATAIAPFPTSGGPYLIYLDVWQREITFLEYPDLVEKAVGVDTAGRYQTVWQVRWLDVSSVSGVTCSTNDSDIGPWETLIQPSAGRLTTAVVQSSTSGPCCLAPNTGYTGLENQLYRVEVHDGGTSGSTPQATFKWSRDNASVATAVTGISQSGTVLTVQSTGKDSVLRFSPNDWVEITDDWRELNGLPGEMHQVALVTDAAKTIQLTTAVSSANFPVDSNNQTYPDRHTRVIRWDQSGKVYQADGTTVWTDLDVTGTGLIPLPPPGTSLILENGVTVSFDLNPGTGQFKVGDFWNLAARTVDGTVENLIEAPPRGIHHHYARLSIFTPGGTPSDCRVEWPPAGEGGGCDCASCVTAQSHNNGSWTIQDGINAVIQQGGGKVCLGPGVYNIAQTIMVFGANQTVQNLAICGHGLPTLLPVAGFEGGSIMSIELAGNIDVEGVAFAGGALNPTGAGGLSGPTGLTIEASSFVRVTGCSFGLYTDTALLSPAISFSSMVVNCTLRDNLFTNVIVGIGLGGEEGYFLLTQIDIEHNVMYCTEAALWLADPQRLFVTELRFAHNHVQSISGFTMSGQGLNVIVDDNIFYLTAAAASQSFPQGAAVNCNVGEVYVTNNQIGGTASQLTVTPGTGGGLLAGNYTWVITALDSTGREFLVTTAATATVSGQGNATLSWTMAANAVSYNIYRTAANGAALFLDVNVPQSAGTVYQDTTPDQNLQQNSPLPTLQNDGILLGLPGKPGTSVMTGCRITGNTVSGLVGNGIHLLSNTTVLETIISQNVLLNLCGSGIMVNALATVIDISENEIGNVGLIAPAGAVGILLQRSTDAKLTNNRIEGVGALSLGTSITYLGMEVVSGGAAEITGNRVTDIGPVASNASSGMLVLSLGVSNTRLSVANNEVRRASTLPDTLDQPGWLALIALGRTVSVRGNLLESFGEGPQSNQNLSTLPTNASTAYILGTDTCTFSDNQCFQDFLGSVDRQVPALVVEVSVENQGLPSIGMGNYVQGPTGRTRLGDRFITNPSLTFTAAQPTTNNSGPVVTVLGNITSNGIDVNGAVLGTPWAPLNVVLG